MTELDLHPKVKKRIRRLEIMVGVLFFLFATSIGVSIYAASQIRTVTSSIPSYKEIKQDIQTLNNIYKISEKKIPQAYDYTKDKAVKGYEYGKEKATELFDYIKDKTKSDEKK